MLPVLAFALLAADPGERFDAFMKAHPAFRADFAVSASGRAAGKGTLRVARPHRLRFDVKGPGTDFSLESTPEAYVEVERTERTYDERASTGGFRTYESRISGAPTLLPGFLLAGTVANVFGGNKPIVAPVAGGDELRVTIQSPAGPVVLRLVVAPSGRPVAYSSEGPRGDFAWRIAAFDAIGPDPTPFHVELPLGFVPHALPEMPVPLQVGEAAPLVGWRKAGKPVDLNEPDRGRPRLLAVLSPDSLPSRAARPFLIDLGRTMPVFLIEPGGVTDPSGSLMKRLSPPGTPMFYLVGPDGTVKKLWLGFDVAKGKAWEDEVRAAAKNPLSPPGERGRG